MDAEKLQDLVDELSADIDAVEDRLSPLLGDSLQMQSESKAGRDAATPYALAAYSLSSLIFAYLRSEGEPIDLVQGEIERVQKCVQKLETDPAAEAQKDKKDRPKAPESGRQRGKKTMFK